MRFVAVGSGSESGSGSEPETFATRTRADHKAKARPRGSVLSVVMVMVRLGRVRTGRRAGPTRVQTPDARAQGAKDAGRASAGARARVAIAGVASLRARF